MFRSGSSASTDGSESVPLAPSGLAMPLGRRRSSSASPSAESGTVDGAPVHGRASSVRHPRLVEVSKAAAGGKATGVPSDNLTIRGFRVACVAGRRSLRRGPGRQGGETRQSRARPRDSNSPALLWPVRGSPAQHLSVRHVPRTGQVDVALDDDIRAEGDVALDLQPRTTAQ
jgi:hypothetical protein